LFLENKTLVSGSRDASIRIWDVETGQCKQVLEGHHTATVRSLAASSKSDFFVSGGYDGKAFAWATLPENGKIECLQSLSGGHEGGIYTVCMADDGEVALTGGIDAVLRVWDIRTG
jgi:WD40 repeat protein